MRRTIAVLGLVAIVVFTGIAMSRSVMGIGAQGETSVDLEAHELVGTWIVSDERDTTDAPSLTVISSDGTVVDISAAGRAGAGSWTADDLTAGSMTLVYAFENRAGHLSGSAVIRADIQTDETGSSFTARYSYTEVAPDGTVTQTLMSTARGFRVPVQPVEDGGKALREFIVVETPVGATPSP
jgi:hypothetical protein